MMRCFDKRVLIGLAALAAGLLVIDPHLGWVALPVLAGLACPVSMLVMMRSMRQDAGGTQVPPGGGHAAGDRAAEIAWLRREIELLRSEADHPAPPGEEAPGVSREREGMAKGAEREQTAGTAHPISG